MGDLGAALFAKESMSRQLARQAVSDVEGNSPIGAGLPNTQREVVMKRLGKAIVLLGLAFLLLTVSVVTACGGAGEKESNTIILGWLADQTGASSNTFKEFSMGVDDYLAEMEATNPIPGVNLKVIAYDTRLEYARVPMGYQWLVGQGIDLLLGYQPETSVYTLRDQVEDKMPQYNFVAWPPTMDEDWVYSYIAPQEYESRAVADYLMVATVRK